MLQLKESEWTVRRAVEKAESAAVRARGTDRALLLSRTVRVRTPVVGRDLPKHCPQPTSSSWRGRLQLQLASRVSAERRTRGARRNNELATLHFEPHRKSTSLLARAVRQSILPLNRYAWHDACQSGPCEVVQVSDGDGDGGGRGATN